MPVCGRGLDRPDGEAGSSRRVGAGADRGGRRGSAGPGGGWRRDRRDNEGNGPHFAVTVAIPQSRFASARHAPSMRHALPPRLPVLSGASAGRGPAERSRRVAVGAALRDLLSARCVFYACTLRVGGEKGRDRARFGAATPEACGLFARVAPRPSFARRGDSGKKKKTKVRRRGTPRALWRAQRGPSREGLGNAPVRGLAFPFRRPPPPPPFFFRPAPFVQRDERLRIRTARGQVVEDGGGRFGLATLKRGPSSFLPCWRS